MTNATRFALAFRRRWRRTPHEQPTPAQAMRTIRCVRPFPDLLRRVVALPDCVPDAPLPLP